LQFAQFLQIGGRGFADLFRLVSQSLMIDLWPLLGLYPPLCISPDQRNYYDYRQKDEK
jgi:hypothetical protein